MVEIDISHAVILDPFILPGVVNTLRALYFLSSFRVISNMTSLSNFLAQLPTMEAVIEEGRGRLVVLSTFGSDRSEIIRLAVNIEALGKDCKQQLTDGHWVRGILKDRSLHTNALLYAEILSSLECKLEAITKSDERGVLSYMIFLMF